jgi:hypothetical protein
MNQTNPNNFDEIFDEEARALLQPLAAYDVPIPDGLKAKILLATAKPSLSVEGILQDYTSEGPSRRRIIFNRFVDFLATAAAIIMISTAILLSSSHARKQARKALCAGNLGILGSAVTSYANDYYNQLPYAGTPGNPAWYDMEKKKPCRAHLFILVKKNYVLPQYLVCPEENFTNKNINPKELSALHDFPQKSIVSYSFQNLFGDQKFGPQRRQQRWQQAQQLAIMADRTPLLLTNEQLMPELDSANIYSKNHSNLKGQNILVLDGRVLFQQSPYFGPKKDNIWQAGSIYRYNGQEIPADVTDSFLAP